MAEQDNERNDDKERLEQAAVKIKGEEWEKVTDLHYEDEEGSVTVRKRDMKKLNIQDGDVVVVKRFDGLTAQAIDWLAEQFGEKGFGNCIVVVVDKMSDIKSLDENVMKHYGWIRNEE
ncbi:MAG: hypothetical protein ACW99G_17065 [Candidatus Thorarchaeota archaeon]